MEQLSFNNVYEAFGTVRERWDKDTYCTCLQEPGNYPFSFFTNGGNEICCQCNYKRRFMCLKGQDVHPGIMPELWRVVEIDKYGYPIIQWRGHYIKSLHEADVSLVEDWE